MGATERMVEFSSVEEIGSLVTLYKIDTMPRTKSANGKVLSDNKKILRYWVELRDLTNRSIRNLPLTAIAKIHIPRSKKEAQRPTEEILQLKDGSATLEAKTIDEFAAQLGARYPDGKYERTLHHERGREAEERRAEAMNRLIRILAEAAVQNILNNGVP
jgi:hypothetical protein